MVRRICKYITSSHATTTGTALATCGEDGHVKVWSRAGMLRSTLATLPHPAFSLAWGPDSNRLLVASGCDVVLLPLQGGGALQWKAHQIGVLKVDWSAVNCNLLTGGEDGRVKVWWLINLTCPVTFC